MKKTCKVGLIGLCQMNFLGDKQAAFSKAQAGLSALCEKAQVTFAVYPTLPITRNDCETAANWVAAEKIDFLMIHLSSFAAGETILELAKTAPYLGLWATPEPEQEGVLKLNSYCGLNMLGSILTHYLPVKHKYFFGWPEEPDFVERFAISLTAISALVKLPGTRVGLIGGIAPGFNDLYFDERVWQKKLGLEIHRNMEFSDIRERAEKMSPERAAEYAYQCAAGYESIDELVSEKMQHLGRVYGAYREAAEENGYEAVAISCWPRINQYHDTLACSTLGKLNEYGLPAACEGDLPGAISMLLLQWMGQETTTLLDLVSFDEKDDTIQLWHCGPTAVSLGKPGAAKLSRFYEMDGDNLSRRAAMNDMVIRSSPGSVFRISGECEQALVLTGEMMKEEKPSFYGSRGWFGELRLANQEIGARDLIHTIQTAGLQHHYPYTPALLTGALMEFCAWLDLSPVKAIPYQPYLLNRA